jgi:hypothetical protein
MAVRRVLMEQSWLVACLLFLHVLTASLIQATASQPNAQPISIRSGRNSHKKRPAAMSFVDVTLHGLSRWDSLTRH